jgi:hypothetical protein
VSQGRIARQERRGPGARAPAPVLAKRHDSCTLALPHSAHLPPSASGRMAGSVPPAPR